MATEEQLDTEIAEFRNGPYLISTDRGLLDLERIHRFLSTWEGWETWGMPRSLLERAAALYQHKAGQQSVSLTVKAEPGLPAIAADEARLMQVMDNLLGNALRYTPPGGAIQLSAARAEGTVRIAVADTGPGIAADELPHIFDRFYRADPSRHAEDGQSGLGLAIVKALVEAQGGRVWAESTPGMGTAIQIEFPF